MKMPKKSTRRIIRKRIAQRKSKDAAKQKNNSIRGQLMNVAAQNIANGIRPFGYASQQYGNINNERRIEQLCNDSNLKSSELQNTNAIIETMQKNIKDLSADLKNAKKEKKKIKAEHDKAEHDKEMAEDVLNENRRLEMDNERLREKTRIAERQNALIDKDIHIGELKKQKIELEANLHQKELEKINKQKQIEANIIYNEKLKLQNDIDLTLAENASYENILKSESFNNPNKEYIEKAKQLQLAKEENLYKKKLYDLALENKRQQEELAAMPTVEELNAITKQFADQTIELRNNTILLKQQNIALQDQIDIYDYHHDQYKDAAKAEIIEQYKLNTLSNQLKYTTDQLKKTDANKLYNDQIKRTADLRVKNERQESKLKDKQELLELKKKNDILEKMNEAKTMDLTQDEKDLTESIGAEKARNVILQKKQKLKNDLHEAELKKSEAQANNDYHNSKEYQDFSQNIVELKVETQKNLNKAAALKKTAALAKQLDQSKMTYEITNKLVNANAIDAQELDYHLQEASNLYQNKTQKDLIVKQINDKLNVYPEQWELFKHIRGNENVDDLIINDYSAIDDLKDVYNRFSRFVGITPSQIPPALKYQPQTEQPQENYFNVEDIGHLPDDEIV